MEEKNKFVEFKEQDFGIVCLEYLMKSFKDLTPIHVAEAIIEASEQGQKPVNFMAGSSDEYWDNWTHQGNGRIVDAALDHLGYLATFQTNSTSDGRYYLLERKQ